MTFRLQSSAYRTNFRLVCICHSLHLSDLHRLQAFARFSGSRNSCRARSSTTPTHHHGIVYDPAPCARFPTEHHPHGLQSHDRRRPNHNTKRNHIPRISCLRDVRLGSHHSCGPRPRRPRPSPRTYSRRRRRCRQIPRLLDLVQPIHLNSRLHQSSYAALRKRQWKWRWR